MSERDPERFDIDDEFLAEQEDGSDYDRMLDRVDKRLGSPETAVVVASLVTAGIAAHGADPVLTAEERGGVSERSSNPDALTPALQARNHAATAKP